MNIMLLVLHKYSVGRLIPKSLLINKKDIIEIVFIEGWLIPSKHCSKMKENIDEIDVGTNCIYMYCGLLYVCTMYQFSSIELK